MASRGDVFPSGCRSRSGGGTRKVPQAGDLSRSTDQEWGEQGPRLILRGRRASGCRKAGALVLDLGRIQAPVGGSLSTACF